MGQSRVKVAQAAEVPVGEGRVVQAGPRTVALFNIDGRFYAIDNTCIHRGGPLGEGDVEGKLVTCPWHGWRWDVSTGCHANNPAVKVACFAVAVEDGGVYVELPD